MVNNLCICWSENFDIIEMHGATTTTTTKKNLSYLETG
jgi:hypothetical protein